MTNTDSNEISQAASEIQARINHLVTLSGVDLKNEMANLKVALMQNPSACLLLCEEDIGKLVQGLRSSLGIAIASAAAVRTRTTATKPKKLNAQELNDILEADL